MSKQRTLEELNRMGLETGAEALDFFAHSPWIAKQTWRTRLISTLDEVCYALMLIVRAFGNKQQLALLTIHPAPTGKTNSDHQRVDASSMEQEGVRLTHHWLEQTQRNVELSKTYSKASAMPVITALIARTRISISSKVEKLPEISRKVGTASADRQLTHTAVHQNSGNYRESLKQSLFQLTESLLACRNLLCPDWGVLLVCGAGNFVMQTRLTGEVRSWRIC